MFEANTRFVIFIAQKKFDNRSIDRSKLFYFQFFGEMKNLSDNGLHSQNYLQVYKHTACALILAWSL